MPHLTAHPPVPFDSVTDDSLSWSSRFQDIFIISKVEKGKQSVFILNSLSSNVYRSLSAFVRRNDATELTLQALVDHFKKMYCLKALLFMERYRLLHLKQGSQSFFKFDYSVKESAFINPSGDFCGPAPARVCTMGMNDPYVRAKFLELEECSLDQGLFIAQSVHKLQSRQNS